MLTNRDPGVIGSLAHTEIVPPAVVDIIRRRIEEALDNSKLGDIVLGEGVLQARIHDCPEFIEVLIKGLSHPAVVNLLENISNDSIRDSLTCALRIYNSRFLDARRIIRKVNPVESIVQSPWNGRIPYPIVLKSLMFVNSQIYDPFNSQVGNIFGTHLSNEHLGPYLRLLLLNLYVTCLKWGDRKRVISVAHEIFNAPAEHIEVELAWLDRHSWIEILAHDHLLLSKRGLFFVDVLSGDVDYLTHIATDVDMYESTEATLASPAETPKARVGNLLVLLEYLIHREWVMLCSLSEHRGLTDYVDVIGTTPITDDMILRLESATQRLRNPYPMDPEDMEAINSLHRKLSDLRGSSNMRRIKAVIRDFTGGGWQ